MYINSTDWTLEKLLTVNKYLHGFKYWYQLKVNLQLKRNLFFSWYFRMSRSALSTDSLCVLSECSICFEEFNDPRMLPCLHTFCANCLKQTGRNEEPGEKHSMSFMQNWFHFSSWRNRWNTEKLFHWECDKNEEVFNTQTRDIWKTWKVNEYQEQIKNHDIYRSNG